MIFFTAFILHRLKRLQLQAMTFIQCHHMLILLLSNQLQWDIRSTEKVVGLNGDHIYLTHSQKTREETQEIQMVQLG